MGINLGDCVRGYHVYKDRWAAAIGEVLVCSREGANQRRKFFVVKLYSRKIFLYVFCVRKYFTKSKLWYKASLCRQMYLSNAMRTTTTPCSSSLTSQTQPNPAWTRFCCAWRDVQDCQQRLSSTFDLLLIFLCSLIQTLTPPPNNALLAILDMYMCMGAFCETMRCSIKI